MQNPNLATNPSSPAEVASRLATARRSHCRLLLLLSGLILVVLAALAGTTPSDAAPLWQGTVPPGGTIPTPPAVVLLSLGSSGELQSASDELSYRDEDIISYSPSSGALDLYFDGSAYGLQELDLRDFEILEDGGFIFTGNKAFTLDNPNGTPASFTVDDSDVVRYHPITDSFSIYLRGAEIGLTSAGEDIDALAFAPDGRLLISTIGTAQVNGADGQVAANDEDLLACDVAATPKTCALYFDGSDVRLTRGSEDLMSAWVDPSGSQTHVLSTKGRYVAVGSNSEVEEDREVAFACTPLSAEETTELTDCTFTLFLDSGEAFGTEKQIDGMWLGATISPTVTLVRASQVNTDYDLATEEALDAEELVEALVEAEAEVDLHDVVAVVQELYLPLVER